MKNKELPELEDVEDTIKRIDYKIKDICIEYFNKGYQKARADTIKEVEDMMSNFEKDKNNVLTTSRLKKDKIIIADYILWSDFRKLKAQIKNKSPNKSESSNEQPLEAKALGNTTQQVQTGSDTLNKNHKQKGCGEMMTYEGLDNRCGNHGFLCYKCKKGEKQ